MFAPPYRLTLLVLACALACLFAVGAAEADPEFTPSDLTTSDLIVEQGVTTTLSVHVANSGSAAEVQVQFLADYGSGYELVNSTNYTLSGGGDDIYTAPWIPDSTGVVTVKAKLAADDEQNPLNNEITRSVQVYRDFDAGLGDRVIDGEESFVTYLQDGMVVVDGGGTLTITGGGTFTVGQQVDHELYVRVRTGGTLVVEEGATLKSDHLLNIFLEGKLEVRTGGDLRMTSLQAAGNAEIKVVNGIVQGRVSFTGHKLMVDGLSYAGTRFALDVATTVDITNSTFNTDVFVLRADGGTVTIEGSDFNVANQLIFAPTISSHIANSTFTRPLDGFTAGTHELFNVESPGLAVSGTAQVFREWYLTIRVRDVGNAPIEETAVEVTSLDDQNDVEGTTSANGELTFLLRANKTTATTDDFVGNYRVEVTYDEQTVTRHVILDATKTITVSHPARVNKRVSISVTPNWGEKSDAGTRVSVTGTVKWKSDGTNAVEVPMEWWLELDGKQKTSPATVTTNADGRYSCLFTLPDDKAGEYQVIVTYGSDQKASTRTVVEDEGGWDTTSVIIVLFMVLLLGGFGAYALFNPRTSMGFCEECGSKIHLDEHGLPVSTTCAECGAILETNIDSALDSEPEPEPSADEDDKNGAEG